MCGPNDFTLYELDSPIEFNNRSRPVFLPGKNDEGSASYVVSGWGCLMSRVCNISNALDHADQLQALRVANVPKKKCEKAWADKFKITERMLCAGKIVQKNGYPARGDSGGGIL